MKRIALEARALSARGGGVQRYTVEVIRRLTAQQTPYAFDVFYDHPRHLRTFPNATEHVVPVGHPLLRLVWDLWTLPRALRSLPFDLIHYFKPATSPRKRTRTVATVHDVIPLTHPETQTSLQRAYWRVQLPLVARVCDHLLTISEASKRGIVEELGVPPERVTVTPLGVDPQFTPGGANRVARVRGRYRLPEKFLLFVGTIEPKKNVHRLVRAFARVADRLPHHLVLAGQWGWNVENIARALRDPRVHDRARLLSFVPQDDLPALYTAADAFVFPSIAEGLGLPPLEALACGTPVVTSTTSSLPEAVGPHALLVHPEDEEGLATAIERLVTDRALHDRLAAGGREWVRQFTWERTAEQTLAVYEKVLKTS